MSEVLLPLVPILALAIYIFYVIHCESIKQLSTKADETSLKDNQLESAKQEVTVALDEKAETAVESTHSPVTQSKEKSTETEVIEKSAKVKTTQDLATLDYYRNPRTDELAPVPNNYRFAKRWVKAALVEEGLLDKIYRNNEMDQANSVKVKKALEALAQLPQYRG